MEGFDPATSFGDEVSKRYDADDTRGVEEPTVAFLAGIAGQRAALEIAVGTGRIALPLAQADVRVHGIEMSQHMVDRMREKPDGSKVEVSPPPPRTGSAEDRSGANRPPLTCRSHSRPSSATHSTPLSGAGIGNMNALRRRRPRRWARHRDIRCQTRTRTVQEPTVAMNNRVGAIAVEE
jgi:hypothetical protein